MKEVWSFLIVFLCIFNLTKAAILIPKNTENKLLNAKGPIDRKLLSFVSTEEKNQQYEIARFQRLLNNYVHTLNQKQTTTKQFMDNLDQEDMEVEDKFIQAKRTVKSMTDDALNEIEGTMSTLGLGLS